MHSPSPGSIKMISWNGNLVSASDRDDVIHARRAPVVPARMLRRIAFLAVFTTAGGGLFNDWAMVL